MQIIFCIGIAVVVAALAAVLFAEHRTIEQVRRWTKLPASAAGFSATLLVALFGLLVATGVTGASLLLLYKRAPIVEAEGKHLALGLRGIRSDEWLVLSPLAVGQFYHEPKRPIVNRNLGEEGQNMLVVGMVGAPVRHVSLLAKPATWGFHVFDLRRALAWFWWFPIFAGLLGLWWLFCILFPENWRLALALSLLYCLSSYSVAWSNWPSYAVFFPSVILCSALAMLKPQRHIGTLLGLAIVLALASAGFVLILYPPWQISIGWLYLAIATALVWRDRRQFAFGKANMSALALAAFLCGTILWLWWLDARPAVETMMRTVYPGRREMLTGGGLDISGLLRGFSNIGSLYKLDPQSSTNESEVASFYYLWLPLATGLVLHRKQQRQYWPLSIAVAAFAAYVLLFMFVGISPMLAKITAWGRVPPSRADAALGLSYVILCGCLLAASKGGSAQDRSRPRNLTAALSAGAWALVVAYALSKLPSDTMTAITPGLVLALLSTVFFAGLWMIKRDKEKFIGLSLCLGGATVLAFNPLSIAPAEVYPAAAVEDILSKELPPNGKVLVLGTHVPAMALMSAGVPVANGVFYYPQMPLWTRLKANENSVHLFNRYQHLSFGIGDEFSGEDTFRIESPRTDAVNVLVSAVHFDFGLSGAALLLAPLEYERSLRQNRTLNFLRNVGEWSWFSVSGATIKAHETIYQNKP